MQRVFILLTAILGVVGCAVRGPSAPINDAPDVLKPPPGEAMVWVAAAKGVQIYECREKKDQPGTVEWALVGPDAVLFDEEGMPIGRHYAGPHWEADDGSKVLGQVKARADAPIPDAIPWLLLTAKSDGPEGVLSKVTSVQRIHTTRGMAPDKGCSQANLSKRMRVPYTADYYFFGPK